uniref:lytic transglycosylase domain-containing protein n=1 Tax=uncultured Sphingomonas sp. TaxID=158754 RepID=UPI0025F60455|nr:lytic transglycosylase domain-containing protein [uncultured Sphingomonas sp.]
MLAILCATPASADVIELDANGTVVVRAADRPSPADPVAVPGATDEVQIAPEALTPVLASMAPPAYAAAVEQLAAAHHISPVLLEALVWQESRWRAGARSTAGAIGLAQLMPGTARDLGVNPQDPNANLAGGARYLRQQLDRFGGDVELALAAYNAGPGRVQRARGIPRIRETQAYVRAIVDRLSAPFTSQGKRP